MGVTNDFIVYSDENSICPSQDNFSFEAYCNHGLIMITLDAK